MRNHLGRAGLAVVAAFCVLSSAGAEARVAGASGAAVSFTAVGPAGLKIVGTTSDLSVREDAAAVAVAVPLSNLTTGISLRDKHMKEKYLEVGRYPEAELVVPRAKLQLPKPGTAPVTADADGTMRIHGQTRPVRVHYTARPSGDGFDVEGSARVNMTEYGIQVPSYLGVTVKPEVDLVVKFHAKDA